MDLGHRVRAAGPSPEMLAELGARPPAVRTAGGTAESIPAGDGSVDAVVAGQAAHWFDQGPAAREIRRALRPSGVLGLIWNTRDVRVPWVAALEELLDDEARGHEAHQGVVDRIAAEPDAGVELVESGVVQRLGPADVVAGIGTRSYVAVMDDAGREQFLSASRGCWPATPTPGDARSSSCPTGPTPTGSPCAERSQQLQSVPHGVGGVQPPVPREVRVPLHGMPGCLAGRRPARPDHGSAAPGGLAGRPEVRLHRAVDLCGPGPEPGTAAGGQHRRLLHLRMQRTPA